MGIIGEMKRDKSSTNGSGGFIGGRSNRSTTSSASSDRPRPLSFWGGLSSKASPKSEPVPKGYKLKAAYGGSTGHLDAYGGAYGGAGGMRPAVSMPVVAGPGTPQPALATSSLNAKGAKRNHPHRNSLPPALIAPPTARWTNERAPTRSAPRTVLDHATLRVSFMPTGRP